jgi:hypothetical protein
MTSNEFETDCKFGPHKIKMVQENGKWYPRNIDGTTHACRSAPRIDQPEIVPTSQIQPSLPIEIVEPMDIDRLAEAFKKFEDFKKRLLTEDDSVKIGNKLFLKKSAWRKWALACSVSDEIRSEERIPTEGRDAKDGFMYRITVRAYHIPTGRSSTGVAVASSNEKTKWAHEEHDVFSLCHTRAKSRAISDLVGGGELSAEELQAE